jgi:hypothetical protein
MCILMYLHKDIQSVKPMLLPLRLGIIDKFYGLVLFPDGRETHVEIGEEWIKDNDWQTWYQVPDIISFLKKKTKQADISFLQAGWGSITEVRPVLKRKFELMV